MVNLFVPTDIPTYYWNNLKKGTYNFKFLDISNPEPVKIKSNKENYYKIKVMYLSSDIDFYGNQENDLMYLVLPIIGWEIGLNLYKDRRILYKIKPDDEIYVTLIKKGKKILRFLDISISKPPEEDKNMAVPEEIIM